MASVRSRLRCHCNILEEHPELAHQTNPQIEKLMPAVRLIEDNYIQNPALAEIAQTVHMHPVYFHRQFVKAFKHTPDNFMFAKRMHRASRLLKSTNQTIKKNLGFVWLRHASLLF